MVVEAVRQEFSSFETVRLALILKFLLCVVVVVEELWVMLIFFRSDSLEFHLVCLHLAVTAVLVQLVFRDQL